MKEPVFWQEKCIPRLTQSDIMSHKPILCSEYISQSLFFWELIFCMLDIGIGIDGIAPKECALTFKPQSLEYLNSSKCVLRKPIYPHANS